GFKLRVADFSEFELRMKKEREQAGEQAPDMAASTYRISPDPAAAFREPGTCTPAAGTTPPGTPSETSAAATPAEAFDAAPEFIQEFQLPEALYLRLNEEEKKLIRKLLKFIREHQIESFKECMYIGIIGGLPKMFKEYQKKINPGRAMAVLFGGNENDAKKYVSNYLHPDPKCSKKYLLRSEEHTSELQS